MYGRREERNFRIRNDRLDGLEERRDRGKKREAGREGRRGRQVGRQGGREGKRGRALQNPDENSSEE